MAEKNILWEVGCEGHIDAWVVAPSWEQATLKAAEFWGVSWGSVVAYCIEKGKTVGAPRNVCCKCGRSYFGAPPMCSVCQKSAVLEEAELRRKLNQAYKEGKAV